MRKRGVCAALALALCLSGCGVSGDIRAPEQPLRSLPPLRAAEEPDGAAPLPVYLDGVLAGRGCEKDGARYVDLRPLCARAGIDADWEGDGDGFTLRLGSLRVEGKKGRDYLTASGRYLYAPEGWLIRGEALLLPENAVCKLFSLSARAEDGALLLDAGSLSLLEGGADYYDLNFPMEDLFWLAHIIHSEAGIEPLAGKIAVGNVVMNRVADPEFPDTVFGVVYDYEHTIQFEPVSKGTIHDEPGEEAEIAARLVLEGANTAGDCLYFVNPDFGSFWFDNNLTFVKKIGRHNFYLPLNTSDSGADEHAGTDPAAGA